MDLEDKITYDCTDDRRDKVIVYVNNIGL